MSAPTAWVLILFYFNGGNPGVAMHDFADHRACDNAMRQAVELGKLMPGTPTVQGACVPKAGTP